MRGSDDRTRVDTLLAEFAAAKRLPETERSRSCGRVAEQLAALPSKDYLRDKLIALLDTEPVMAFRHRDLVYGAVWPDSWRSIVHDAVAKAFATPEDHFAYLCKLAKAHGDSDHRGEALQILSRRFAGSPKTFSVLKEVIDGYRRSPWIQAQLRYAESGIIEHFAQLPEALPYLIDSARDDNAGWPLNAAAMKALAEHHRDNRQIRPLLEASARQPRRAQDDQAPGSALELLVKHYPLDQRLCDLLAEVVEIREHLTEQQLILTSLAKARYPKRIEVLHKQADHAAHPGARALAVELLAECFADKTDVAEPIEEDPTLTGVLKDPFPDQRAKLAFLMELACEDDRVDHRVRAAAFAGLAKHFASDDGVQRFFRDNGLVDPQSALRQAVDGMVGRYFTFGEGIMEVLTDRLINDPEAAVRREAAKLLAALSEPDNGRKPQLMRTMMFLHLSAETPHLANAFGQGDLEERIRMIVGYGPLHKDAKPNFVGPDEALFLQGSERTLLGRWPRALCTKQQFRTERVLQSYVCATGYIRFWFTEEYSEEERQEVRKAIERGDPFEVRPPQVLNMARHTAWVGYWLAGRGLERQQLEHGIRVIAEAIFTRKDTIDTAMDFILRGARHYRDWIKRQSLEDLPNCQS
ncbi:hypothetical protein [Pelagibius sp.]|uniref:hypothetical protein n=1 Tax=Pelagibius sp. TaxID=1931238 RepID=UPI002639D93A|nr:hypothetical protein [Pelagibius sp.]